VIVSQIKKSRPSLDASRTHPEIVDERVDDWKTILEVYFTEIARKVEKSKAWGNRKGRSRRRRRKNRDKKKDLPVCRPE